jgi:O-antigen/teichoic acid export membrane protein
MELLFVVLIAFAIGWVLRVLLRGVDTFGFLLLPAASTATTSIIWVALLWLGWTFDGTWIWVVSLVAGGIAALVVGLRLPPIRRAADTELYATLAG